MEHPFIRNFISLIWSSTMKTKILLKTIFAHEFTQFKKDHPFSHVGRFPMPTDVSPMKWIMVYPIDGEQQ
jgi:hypothetical protein